MIDLSILIVSYNTKETTKQCIEKLLNVLTQNKHIHSQIIVIDNGSKDGSVEEMKSQKLKISRKAGSRSAGKSQNITFKVIESKENLGFGRANNEGLTIAEGKYILFLNSDVYMQHINLEDLLSYMDNNHQVGALTVQVRLPSGKIDMASHRGFPTIWRSFTYFTKAEQSFGKLSYLSRLFGGYHLLHLNFNTIHEVEAISGAFFLTRKSILDQIGGFDTRFFMYGEDIDLCYQMLMRGYKIVYYPRFSVLHLKYQSGIKKKEKRIKNKTTEYFYDSMCLFYDKYMAQKNPAVVNYFIHFFIYLKKHLSS